MPALYQTCRIALAAFLSIVGFAALTLGLWLVDQQFLGIFNPGVYLHDLTVNGNPISMSVVLLILGSSATVSLTFAALLVGRSLLFRTDRGSK